MFLTNCTVDDEITLSLPVSDMPKRKGIRFTSPADVSIRREVTEVGLRLIIKTQVSAEFDCYRCCKHVKRCYKNEVEEVFPEGDDYLVWSLRDGVDVKEPVFEAVYNTLPVMLTCSDDCLGLCPVCGADRNVKKCKCNELSTDSSGDENPFAVLKNKFGN